MARTPVPQKHGGHHGPLDVFSSLQREIDRVFSDFSRPAIWPGVGEAAGVGWQPSIDLSETPTHIEVTAELPGVKEDDIEVSVHDDVLTVKGEKKAEHEKKDKDYHLVERSYGSFERRMRLPCEVDTAATEATFKNGVLNVSLKKAEPSMAKTHKVPVKSA